MRASFVLMPVDLYFRQPTQSNLYFHKQPNQCVRVYNLLGIPGMLLIYGMEWTECNNPRVHAGFEPVIM